MIFSRHPLVANLFIHELEGMPEGALGAAAEAKRAVTGMMGFIHPVGMIWPTEPAHPRQNQKKSSFGVDEDGSMRQHQSWRSNTGRSVYAHEAEPKSTGEVAGRPRSWHGFVCCSNEFPHIEYLPTCSVSCCMRRLQFPLPLSLHTCRCGRQIDKFGHHRASCARAGVLGRERVRAGKCNQLESGREAGGRVSTHVMVRDLDLGDVHRVDGRQLEVVVDGLPLFGGVSWQWTPQW